MHTPTRSRRLATALAAAGLLAIVPAAEAATQRIELRRDGQVRSLGGFRPLAGEGSATIAAASRVFGPPTSRERRGTCLVRWRPLGLAIHFTSFGGFPEGKTVCSNDVSFGQIAVIKGSAGHAWRTPRGLRVGDSRARMLRLYPKARYRGGAYPGWWLHSAQLPYGGPGPSQIVWALITRGRVSSIRVWLGGAGD